MTAVPAPLAAASEGSKAADLEADATYRRIRRSLDKVNAIISQSRQAVDSSRELVDRITAARSAGRFSIENRCELELAFSLGFPAADKLSSSDRSMVRCVCGELDEIAIWQGTYEARTRFDALLQLFALSQEGSTLH